MSEETIELTETTQGDSSASAGAETNNSDSAEKLREKLQKAHALNTEGDWMPGRLSNIRIRPKFNFVGKAVKDADEITTHSLSELYGSYSRKVVKSEPPFVQMDRRDIPYSSVKLNSIRESNFKYADSLEKIYTIGDSDTEYLLVPMEDFETEENIRESYLEDLYLVGTVEFEVIGKLESEDLLESQTVVLDTLKSLSDLQTLSYYSELSNSGELSVQYSYTEEKLSLRYMKIESKNLTSKKKFKQFGFVSSMLLWVGSLVGLLNVTTPIFNGFGFGTQLVFYFIFGVIYSVVFTLIASEVFNQIGEKVTFDEQTFNKLNVIDSTGNTTPIGLSIPEIEDVLSRKRKIREKAEKLKQEIEKQPREVTVTPNEDATKLVSSSRDVSWTIADEQMADEDSVEFFIEYGFMEDMEQIETHMVKKEEVIPSYLPAIKSDCGEWFLLPEKIQPDPIMKID